MRAQRTERLQEALTPFHCGCFVANVMFRVAPSPAQIGGDLSMCTQIFLGTTATIPRKQDPLQPGQSQIQRAAGANGAPEMPESEAAQPIGARVWGCPWPRGGLRAL